MKITIDTAALEKAEAEKALQAKRLEGIEFDGIMCSAIKADQDGLMAVLIAHQLQGANFAPTRFEFANGNVLVITKDNIKPFTAVWMPFRQSFFVLPEPEASEADEFIVELPEDDSEDAA